MLSRLQLFTLALLILSIALNIAILGTASHTLSIWTAQHHTNPWLLPLWPRHFDLRELSALIGTAAVITVLNAILALALLLPSRFSSRLCVPRTLDLIALSLAGLGSAVSVVAMAFPAALTLRAPGRDTLQTWTCRWSANGGSAAAAAAPPSALPAAGGTGQGGPSGFGQLCAETRFAFYTTIPVLLLQLSLLATVIHTTLVAHRPASRHSGAEKDGHQLDDYQRKGFGFRTKIDGGGNGDQVKILENEV